MDESYVIRAVCERIEDKGCSVTQFLNTKQRGVDVKATHSKEGDEFFIEAKGGTSSRVGSARFGNPTRRHKYLIELQKVFLRAYSCDHKIRTELANM